MNEIEDLKPTEPFTSVLSKRKRNEKKPVEIEIASKTKKVAQKTKQLLVKKKVLKKSNPPINVQDVVEVFSSLVECTSRSTELDTRISSMLHRMVNEVLKKAILAGLKMKISRSSTMTPVFRLPISVKSNEWRLILPLLKSEEFQVFSSTKRGFALMTWRRTDCVLNELCYKLDISGDVAIICPITCIQQSGKKCFVIEEVDLGHYKVFIPIKASSLNNENDDPFVQSPFGLGFRFKGTMHVILKTDVGAVHPVTLASCGDAGKVEICGKLTKFGKSGYFIFGLMI